MRPADFQAADMVAMCCFEGLFGWIRGEMRSMVSNRSLAPGGGGIGSGLAGEEIWSRARLRRLKVPR